MNEKMLFGFENQSSIKNSVEVYDQFEVSINPIAGHMSPGTNELDSPLFGSGTHYIQLSSGVAGEWGDCPTAQPQNSGSDALSPLGSGGWECQICVYRPGFPGEGPHEGEPG